VDVQEITPSTRRRPFHHVSAASSALRQARGAQPPHAPAHEGGVGAVGLLPERQVADAVALAAEGASEQVGEEGVGGLVGGQVRRDHQDVHEAGHARANSA
jgi:hypothetical protein